MSDKVNKLNDDELANVSGGTNNDLSVNGWYHHIGEEINIHWENFLGITVSTLGEVTALGAIAYDMGGSMLVTTRAIYIRHKDYSGWYPDDYSGRLFHNERYGYPTTDSIKIYYGSK